MFVEDYLGFTTIYSNYISAGCVVMLARPSMDMGHNAMIASWGDFGGCIQEKKEYLCLYENWLGIENHQ